MSSIDTPDLAEALANDADGSVRAELNTYLDDWRLKLGHAQRAGLALADYEAAGRLVTSIAQAQKLLEFFATFKMNSFNEAEQTKQP
ncbi:MAG: hypothetical protein ACAI34_18550 [Verrucomicrobium sp.]|nr:hypothetical protein [Verrucomicrobium sp.]